LWYFFCEQLFEEGAMLKTVQNARIRVTSCTKDRPFWSKRWVPTNAASAKVEFIDLPTDQTVLPKRLDPDWRNNRKVVLFRKPTLVKPTRAVIKEDGLDLVTPLAFNEEYFSMRIGPENVQVALEDFYQNWSQPELCLDKTGKFLILTQAQMGMYITCNGLDCTHI
jgi:hypothetical protein